MQQKFRTLLAHTVRSAWKPLHPAPVGSLMARALIIAFVPLVVSMMFGFLAVALPQYGDAFSAVIAELLAPRLMLSMLVMAACLLSGCLLLRWGPWLQRPFLTAFHFALAVAFNCAVAIAGVAAGLLLPVLFSDQPLVGKAVWFAAIYCPGFLACFMVILAKAPEGKLDWLFGGRLWLRDLASVLFAILLAHAWMIDKTIH